jgi:pimeloyl-ACP methyl ester carboxylesterase
VYAPPIGKRIEMWVEFPGKDIVTNTPNRRESATVVNVDWDLREAGPVDADHTVLLLPGGLCSAGSYAEVMAEPALGRVRLVAATLPGHAGAVPPGDYSIENCARLASDLARKVGAKIVVGFSMGASVALEMVASGGFAGPAILLGVSLSAQDEPAFFHAIVRLGSVLGSLPAAVMAKGAASMVRQIAVSPERQNELRNDFRRNIPQHVMPALREYVRWLQRYERPAERLCRAGVPTWIVHAEKGDGRLSVEERRSLLACPNAQLVTIPGTVFFLPNQVPKRIADVILEAVGSLNNRPALTPASDVT